MTHISIGVLLALAPTVSAHAGPEATRATTMIWGEFLPGDTSYGEVPLEIPQGGSLQFVNLDYVIGSHSLVEYRLPGDITPPSFASEVIDPGNVTEVHGIADLEPGTYRFFCGNHGPTMQGALTITT